MAYRQVQTAKGYKKSLDSAEYVEDDLYKSLEDEEYQLDGTRKTKWQALLLQKTDQRCYVVLVPDTNKSIGLSFGIGFTEDMKQVDINYRVIEMDTKTGKPKINKVQTITEYEIPTAVRVRTIVERYLDCLEKFGDFYHAANNCINFTTLFIEALTGNECGYSTKIWKVASGARKYMNNNNCC